MPEDIQKQIDDILFRCFAQGQYWGTGGNKESTESYQLDPDYKPENPIDRTAANKLLITLFEQYANQAVLEELEHIKGLDEPAEYSQNGKEWNGLAIPRNKIINRIAALKHDGGEE